MMDKRVSARQVKARQVKTRQVKVSQTMVSHYYRQLVPGLKYKEVSIVVLETLVGPGKHYAF
jgi:hypothetical protein